jgi:hypothetical protein
LTLHLVYQCYTHCHIETLPYSHLSQVTDHQVCIHRTRFSKSYSNDQLLDKTLPDKASNLKEDKLLSKDDVIERWKEVFDQLIHWYDVADSKSLGIITINGLLLSFLTLSSIVGIQTVDIQTIDPVKERNPAIFWLLLVLIISVISSVLFAIGALWARIGFDSSILPRMAPARKTKTIDLPSIFFFNISNTYPTPREHLGRTEGKRFYEKEMRKYDRYESWLRAMALEIVVLSTNVKKKYLLINLSFAFVFVSLILMAAIIISNYD